MAAPKFVQCKKATVHVSFGASETTEIVISRLVDIYNNELTMSDFGTFIALTINPGSETNEEIITATDFTRNDDGTVSLSGITRMVLAKSPYSASGTTALSHAAGERVVLSNNPQLYDAILDYIDGIALAGAPDASTTAKGLVEAATLAELRARAATGSTGAVLVPTCDIFNDLPTEAQKGYLDAIVGMISPYAGASAPTGFLLCDGAAYNIATYPALALVARDYYGRNTGAAFTADAGTDVCTATSHGLTDGDMLFVANTGGALPTGLSANTPYYVRDATTNTFKLATSFGGSAIDITGAGTGTHTFHTQFRVPDLRGSVFLGAGTRVRTMTFDGASSVDPSNDQITVASNDWLHTGQAVALTGSALPTGLSATTYYVIRVNATTIKLASSVANANAGTAVDITADGSGTCTLTQTLTARTVGQTGGEETHALTDAQMASHEHPRVFNNGGGSSTGNIAGSLNAYTTETYASRNTGPQVSLPTATVEGSDTPHNVMNPYTVGTYIIKY